MGWREYQNSTPCDNIDNMTRNTHIVDKVDIVFRDEALNISQWGDHACLVQWFLQVKDTLPSKPFCIWREGQCSIHWMTPTGSYRVLTREIEQGPGGQYDAEVRSILDQLHAKFGNGA